MRIINTFLVAALLVLCGVATALAFGEIRYTNLNLNLRAERDSKSEWVGLLFAGQKVRVDDEVDGWVAVYEPDATDKTRMAGYANLKYLHKKGTVKKIKPWGERLRAKGAVNIRREPSLASATVGRLESGQEVIGDFPEDGWIGVFPASATIRSRMAALGFCMGSLLVPADQAAAPVPAPKRVAPVQKKPVATKVTEPHKPWGRVLALNEPVALHANRTVASKVTRTLPRGDRVKIGLKTGDWYAVFGAGESSETPERALGYATLAVLEGRETVEVPVPAKVKPAPKPAPAPAPKPIPAAKPEPKKEEPVRIVIKPEDLKSAPRPAPATDSVAHGFKFKILDQNEIRVNGFKVTRVRVYVDLSRIPAEAELRDFARTVWTKVRRRGKEMLIDLYLPGMDLDDIAYVSATFDDNGLAEYWERKTALYGTKFMQ